jgi:hypothetical protein
MELATPGRVEVPPVPTLIREGQTPLEKCFGSFAITLLSNATEKLRIASTLDEVEPYDRVGQCADTFEIGRAVMSGDREANEERPCLHCLIVELVDDFFAENPVVPDEPNVIDTDELITAVAKTVAELTSSQGGSVRQSMVEQLMREIMKYDAQFRQQEAMGAPGSDARH